MKPVKATITGNGSVILKPLATCCTAPGILGSFDLEHPSNNLPSISWVSLPFGQSALKQFFRADHVIKLLAFSHHLWYNHEYYRFWVTRLYRCIKTLSLIILFAWQSAITVQVKLLLYYYTIKCKLSDFSSWIIFSWQCSSIEWLKSELSLR